MAHNKANIEKVNALSSMVADYNMKEKRIYKQTDRFMESVNNFFQDSGKNIHYDENGFLSFYLAGDPTSRDLRTMSSGEIQLIVLFAHLYFNPETKRANVFIIDEPELSLHVQWQEKFVDALIDASTNMQFIMATHSPTIIINRTSFCKEILHAA